MLAKLWGFIIYKIIGIHKHDYFLLKSYYGDMYSEEIYKCSKCNKIKERWW